MSEGVIIAVIGIAGAIVGGLIQAALQRRKDDAEVNQLITESVTSLIQPLKDRIDDVEIELKDWRNCAEARGRQLERVNIVPAPFVSSKVK